MNSTPARRFGRRSFLKGGPLVVAAAGLDLVPAFAVAGDTPAVGSQDPKLAPRRAVVEKVAALKPNHGVLLGKADVVGEFNDTARLQLAARRRIAGGDLRGRVARRQHDRNGGGRLGVRPVLCPQRDPEADNQSGRE